MIYGSHTKLFATAWTFAPADIGNIAWVCVLEFDFVPDLGSICVANWGSIFCVVVYGVLVL